MWPIFDEKGKKSDKKSIFVTKIEKGEIRHNVIQR